MRSAQGRASGEILISENSYADPKVRNWMINASGYVTQFDATFSEFLTLRENLVFAARLRLPAAMSERTRMRRVHAVIADLGLGTFADTRVGGELAGPGLSGGQKKRLSVAFSCSRCCTYRNDYASQAYRAQNISFWMSRRVG